MPTTYDQTCIVISDDKPTHETYIVPRPIPPKGLVWDHHGFMEYNGCEWSTDGLIIQRVKDGSISVWYPKPTIKQAVSSAPTGEYFRFYADGSCIVRYCDGVDKRTLYYGEEREVD